jgi:menaquinone-specific isochorismate synthase
MSINIKGYLNKTIKNISTENILFRYKEKINWDTSSISFIFNSSYPTFRFSYPNNIEYIGIDYCIKYNLKSITDNWLNELKDIKLPIKSFGKDKGEVLKIFGGVSFNIKNKLKNPWENIPVIFFVVPKILITKEKNQSFISYHCILNKNSDINKIINNYNSILNNLKNTNSIIKNNLKLIKDVPERKEYTKIFNSLTNDIDNNNINKVVLSRMKIYSILNKCILKKDELNCTNFHIDFINNERFIGSTPEKIIDIKNKKITTQALAGTLRKNDNNDLNEFLKNKKELDEHQYVVQDLIKKLNLFSDNISLSKKPTVIELEHLYHINTTIKGTLKKKIHILDVLYKLYPTPAVLGTPMNNAMDAIIKNEPFDRGWYGGCVGWFDLKGEGRFDVAIRTALQKNNKLYSYAGSGLINNANENYEWEETQAKFSHLLSLID